MDFKLKMLIVAMAATMPWVSANAQSQADLQKEIANLRAQLQALQQKVEALNAAPTASTATVSQQVNRLEQRLDLADDEKEKAGFKGLKINGTIEAAYKMNDLDRNNAFSASAGYGAGESAMLQVTKESQDGQGVDWTLRLLPGATSWVHEASLSIPVDKENRVIAGLIPDFQGYEYSFPNANPTLGNQLITHNALFDVAGPATYSGIGMAHTFVNGQYALKWVVGNIDSANDSDSTVTAGTYAGTAPNKSVGLAFRGDWFMNEFAYVGLSGAVGSVNRNFKIFALDGGYVRGDWAFNGQVTVGAQDRAAYNGSEARWTGLSGMVGYKATPRLQLIARADYIDNRANGGGTYVYNSDAGTFGYDSTGVVNAFTNIGLGPELDASGTVIDPNVGANLMRLTIGTNYQINTNTQWKLEYRADQSTGANFVDIDGNFKRTKTSLGTALMLSF